MSILLINPGSASKKLALYRGAASLAAGEYELAESHTAATLRAGETEQSARLPRSAFPDATAHFVDWLVGEGILADRSDLRAVGLRIVASGSRFQADHRIDTGYLGDLEAAKERSPLHLAPQLAEAKLVPERFPGLPLIGVSDSAFHARMPQVARRYALSDQEVKQHDLYRFGFHGLSLASVVRNLRARKVLPIRTVVCHLGSGCSVTALRHGRSVDTTMGFTPLEGVMMGTRSGDVDPGAVLYLAGHFRPAADLEALLNQQSGLLGVGGSADVRQLLARKSKDRRAAFALELFTYRLAKAVGAMGVALGGVDALVFTGAIGERSAPIRKMVSDRLEYLGIRLDAKKNRQATEQQAAIQATGSRVRVLTVPTDEAGEMARRVRRALR